MRHVVAGLMLGSLAVASIGRPAPPLDDPVALAIGLNCTWQPQCIAQQKRAMGKALKYVQKYRPPEWRIHRCNKNAGRTAARVDWVGFDHCIRNEAMRPLPPRAAPHPKHHRSGSKTKEHAGRPRH